MNKLATALLALATTAATAAAQLPTGVYLVGTQGWDTADLPDPTKDTVQLVDPYANTATVLNVTGRPTGEIPSAFVVENPVSFLMGTKVAAAPAAGNLYRVTLNNGTWRASQLNQSPLNINVNALAIDGAYAYILGSAIFGNTGTDALIMRVALSGGAVTVHAMFGKDFNPTTPGARGIGTAMLRIGTVLHAFTFDSRGENVAQSVYPINQHWAISTTTPATYTQVGQDLPYSNRFTLRGYATTGVTVDMATGNLVVIGRWGELLMRTTAGVNVGNEQWPGNLVFNGSQNTELPRGIALNTDTGAIALGDHDSASIDERRCAGAPFLNNVATTVRPSVGTFTVAAMTYVPTNNRAIPAGHGCNDSTGSVPCSYIASPPAPGNSRFAFTLMTKANLATLFVGTRLTMPFDFGPLGAPGCQAYVFPHAVHPVTTRISTASFAIGVPPGARKVSFLAQWLVFDPKANPLGLTLSDAREIIIP